MQNIQKIDFSKVIETKESITLEDLDDDNYKGSDLVKLVEFFFKEGLNGNKSSFLSNCLFNRWFKSEKLSNIFLEEPSNILLIDFLQDDYYTVSSLILIMEYSYLSGKGVL